MDERAAPGAGQVVMVVDDEPMVLRVLDRILRGAGYDVILVQGEDQIDRYLANSDLGVVLLDLFMGRAHGVEVLERIKGERPDIEVVMVTGHGSIDSAVHCMRRGAFDYLEKPFRDLDRIRTTVRAALAKRSCRLSGGDGQIASFARTSLGNEASPREDVVPLSLEAYERLALERALAECAGDARLAATRLGIGRSTFYRKAAKLGIPLGRANEDDDFDPAAGGGVGRGPAIG